MKFEIIICPECESDDIKPDGDWFFCTACGHRWLRVDDDAGRPE